jgi:hypothetical protein
MSWRVVIDFERGLSFSAPFKADSSDDAVALALNEARELGIEAHIMRILVVRTA